MARGLRFDFVLLNFGEEGFVADFELLGGFPPVPLQPAKSLGNHVLLSHSGCFLADDVHSKTSG